MTELRLAALALLLVGVGALLAEFYRCEKAHGRFVGRPTPTVDERWLEEQVFSLLPEEAGAAWFDQVGEFQVLALVVRLAQDGKLRAEPTKEHSGLRLERIVPLARFEDHEKALVEALFVDGATETSTDELRKRYGPRGGKLTASITPGLMARSAGHADLGDVRPPPSRLGTAALAIASAALFASSHQIRYFFTGILFIGVTSLGAHDVAKNAGRMGFRNTWFEHVLYAVLGLWPAGMAVVFDSFQRGAGIAQRPGALAGLVLAGLAVSSAVLAAAKTRDGTRRLERRYSLETARAYFRTELARPGARIPERWIPYLLSLGLGPELRYPVRADAFRC